MREHTAGIIDRREAGGWYWWCDCTRSGVEPEESDAVAAMRMHQRNARVKT